MIEFYIETHKNNSAQSVTSLLDELNKLEDVNYHSTHRVSNKDGYLFAIKGTWDLYRKFSEKFEELQLDSLAHYEE